jgi:hypothetical protein
MQLRNARLCLDCEEVHDAQQCPTCASETFAFVTRWVPIPERRGSGGARAMESDRVEALNTYRLMLEPERAPLSGWGLMKRGAVGLALFGVAGLMWRRNAPADGDPVTADDQPDEDGTAQKSKRVSVAAKR